jgi:hypothetical protein
MKYIDFINGISKDIKPEIVNLNMVRKRGIAPTQAFSEFLTNSEQGDWAEVLFYNSLCESEIQYIPIRYGKSDKITAGDPNFKEFYNSYQDELDKIGKRPDILLFRKLDYKKEWGNDISHFPLERLNNIVPLAVAGFEVRSSAYLTKKFIAKKERPFLSFTPKVEDLLVVLKWINSYGVPHYYVQVFFDSIYIISFADILLLLQKAESLIKGKKNIHIIGTLDNKTVYAIEKNPKNQYKETIHLYIDRGTILSDNIEYPELIGQRKELPGGRLLHFVTFKGGKAKIDKNKLLELIH